MSRRRQQPSGSVRDKLWALCRRSPGWLLLDGARVGTIEVNPDSFRNHWYKPWQDGLRIDCVLELPGEPLDSLTLSMPDLITVGTPAWFEARAREVADLEQCVYRVGAYLLKVQWSDTLGDVDPARR